MRLNSSVECAINSARSLKVSATLPAMPVQPTGSRILKSPFLSATKPDKIIPESTAPFPSSTWWRAPLVCFVDRLSPDSLTLDLALIEEDDCATPGAGEMEEMGVFFIDGFI